MRYVRCRPAVHDLITARRIAPIVWRVSFGFFLLSVFGSASARAFPSPSLVDVLEDRLGQTITAKTLTEILKENRDRELCNWAVLAAGEFGPDAKELVPLLTAALELESLVSRVNVVYALGQIGPGAAAAVPALIRALDDRDEIVSGNAVGALESIGADAKPYSAELIAAFSRGNDSGHNARWGAAAALGQIGSDARDATPALVAALQRAERSPYIREAVATALGRVAAPGDRTVVAALSNVAQIEDGGVSVGDRDTLAAEEASVRIAAALALWKKTHDRRVIGWLMEPLEHKDNPFYLREKAAEALGEIGSDAAAAVPLLITLVTDWAKERDDHRCSVAAVVALGRIGRRAKAAVPVLIGELDPGNRPGLREPAAEALGQMGPTAQEGLPALLAALENDGYEVRIAAAGAIRRLGGDTVATIPVLIDCLAIQEVRNFFRKFPGIHQAAGIRASAANALGELGPRAKPAVAALQVLLDDDFITVRDAADAALRAIAGETQP